MIERRIFAISLQEFRTSADPELAGKMVPWFTLVEGIPQVGIGVPQSSPLRLEIVIDGPYARLERVQRERLFGTDPEDCKMKHSPDVLQGRHSTIVQGDKVLCIACGTKVASLRKREGQG